MRIEAITLKQLRALAAINQRGSITMAADALRLTVPAVSTQLKQLEVNIGAQLVVRDKEMGSSQLTPHGLVLLNAIQRIEASLVRAQQCSKALNEGKLGFISLGVVSTGKYYAPQLVVLAKKLIPDIQIELLIGNRRKIISSLEDGSIDLAIMGRPPRQPIVSSIALGDHPHVLIAPPGHVLVGNEAISPEQLLEQTFIKREIGSGTRILTERYLDRIGNGAVYEWLEFNTNETIKQAVIAGLGIALISGHTVIEEIKSKRIVTLSLPNLPIIRRWYIVKVKDVPTSPIVETVIEFLVEQEKNYLPVLPGY